MLDDAIGAATGPTEVEVGHTLLRSQLVQNLDFLWRAKNTCISQVDVNDYSKGGYVADLLLRRREQKV
jgi:hypothetical protein